MTTMTWTAGALATARERCQGAAGGACGSAAAAATDGFSAFSVRAGERENTIIIKRYVVPAAAAAVRPTAGRLRRPVVEVAFVCVFLPEIPGGDVLAK